MPRLFGGKGSKTRVKNLFFTLHLQKPIVFALQTKPGFIGIKLRPQGENRAVAQGIYAVFFAQLFQLVPIQADTIPSGLFQQFPTIGQIVLRLPGTQISSKPGSFPKRDKHIRGIVRKHVEAFPCRAKSLPKDIGAVGQTAAAKHLVD